MAKNNFYNNLCEPAQLYLILSDINIFLSLYIMSDTPQNYISQNILIQIIFTVIWIYILNFLCKDSLGTKIAWAIVLLPFFFYMLILVSVMCFLGAYTPELFGEGRSTREDQYYLN